MASEDEPTPDESGETSTSADEPIGGEANTSADDSSTDDSSTDALDFGSKAEGKVDASAQPEIAERKSEPEEAASPPDDKASSDDDPSDEPGDDEPGEPSEKEAYDPNKLPPLSQRAMLFGAWGCVGLLGAVALVFFILIKSAIDKIDDYGAVASDQSDQSDPPEGELPPPEEPEEPDPPAFTRTIEWATSYPEARAAARIDLRPIVIVFTAEYATESIDVFDGVFTNDDIESYLERYYQVVHIDMGAQGATPDPSIALCEVEFLPHVCYLHPETEAKLTPDTTGLTATSAVFRDLGAGLAAYEASTEAE